MKKLLSTIMAVVMLLSLVPMAVAEEGAGTENGAVQSNNVYEVSEAAQLIWAAKNHTGVVKLMNDVALDESLNIGSVDSEQKVLTLDLNGHSISATNLVIGVQNANLTVTGPGKIYETSPYFGAILIKGSDNAENKDYTVVTVGAGVELEGWSPIFVDQYNGCAYGVAVNVDGAKLTGKTDTSGDRGSAIYVNGTIKDQNNAPKLVLNNVTQTTEGTGMYLAGYANTTITGGSITGGNTGIEIRAGELTVNGATVVGNGVPTGVTPNGNGSTTDGAGIAVAQHTTKLPIKVTINSGDISGYSALYQSNPQNNGAESVEKVSVAVNGGTFKAINGGTCGVYSENNCVTISGGAFTDLANAVKYATDGAKITLAGDVSAERINLEDKSITVDLNGHTLTSTSAYGVMFCAKNGNTITVNGTTPGSKLVGTVMVTAGTDGHIVLNGGTYESDKYVPVYINGAVNTENSTLKIKDAVITAISSSGGQDMGCGMYLAGYATSTIENTEITAPVTGIEIRAGKLDLTNCTVTGGNGKVAEVANGNGTTVTNAAVAVSQHTTKKNIDVTIKDGEYTATAALYQTDVQGTGSRGVKATVLSGMFTGEVKAATEGAITISAGAFNVAPDAKYLAEGMIVVPGVKDAPYNVQPAKREDENSKSEVKVDGDNVTVTVTDKTTGTTTETVTDTKTGAETVTKTETKVEGNVTAKTETVTEKNAADETTKATETVTTVKTENGGTTTVVTKKDTLNKTETTEVTGVIAPTTASDVTLDVKNTTSVAVNKDSMAALTGDTVKDVIIETDQATLKLDKAAVKTMESNVPTNGKMTLNVTVTEEKNATTTEIEKAKVEVNAKNEAGQNVFPKDTENTNGLINITIPYTGNAKYLDLWYIAANGRATYMDRFPVVNGFVSFDVKHFSQYDLIPVASSGSSVIKTGAGSSAASTTQTVTTDLTPGSITKVTVDGKVVDAKYYTVSGSNVTFTAEFLKTLKNGSHTVTVENATKIAKGVFTVNNPTTAQSPTTADAGIALYAGMAIASVMGTGVVFTSRKRKNH